MASQLTLIDKYSMLNALFILYPAAESNISCLINCNRNRQMRLLKSAFAANADERTLSFFAPAHAQQHAPRMDKFPAVC